MEYEYIDDCPECDRELIKRRNRTTGEYFAGCRGYPRCRYTRNIAPEIGDTYLPHVPSCSICNIPMIQRTSSFGKFFGCVNWRECGAKPVKI